MDFTMHDNASVFPIRIHPDGEEFSFCPAKAFWDSQAVEMSKILLITAETGQLWRDGGISLQPAWYTDIVAWFLVKYENAKFFSRVKMILGGADSGNNQRNSTNIGKNRGGKGSVSTKNIR
jgi:hypothetical protein